MTDTIKNRFEHKPLDTTKNQIRLVTISRSSWEAHAAEDAALQEVISCSIEHYDLKEDHVVRSNQMGRRPMKVTKEPLQYTAVSHTWGDGRSSRQILVNGRPVLIRSNLYDFLEVMERRRDDADQLLWIDQLCIDQDQTVERNHQVQLMADIFSRAEQVIAWLGMDTSNTKIAITALTDIKNA